MKLSSHERFDCIKCGECCRNLHYSAIYKSLDRGDGVCKHLVGNLCEIYEERPLLCRVDEAYEEFFSEELSKDEYYELNKKACMLLRKKEDN